MARIDVDRGALIVRLNVLEKIGAFRGNVRVARVAVKALRVAADPWEELRGVHAGGVGWPHVFTLGGRRAHGVHDFDVLYGRRPALVIELEGESFDRLMIASREPEVDLTRIAVG